MGTCACHGIQMIVVGAILVLNNRGWLWTPLDDWLVVGGLLMVLGLMKAVMPICPVHCKAPMPSMGSSTARTAKKGK